MIRGAAVKVTSRDRQFTLLRRPIQHLYPLEIKVLDPQPATQAEVTTHVTDPRESENNESPDNDAVSKQVPTAVHDPPRRPMRAAAKKAN